MKHHIIKGKDRGTIVFIHGNSSSADVFNNTMLSNSITQTRIAVDLPGHGNNLNNYTHTNDFSIASYCNKLIAFIAQIDDDILLVGNSLGGHLAIEIVNDLPRLKGLIIFGTPPLKKPINFEEAFLPVPALQTFVTENPTEIEIEEAANVAVFKKENAFKVIEDFKKSNPKVRKAIGIDLSEGNFSDQFQLFTNFKVPKFIIAGQQDPSVNLEYLKAVKEECKGTCELTIVTECGHYPSLEKPEEFADILKDIILKVF